jgi:hypothetical protein
MFRYGELRTVSHRRIAELIYNECEKSANVAWLTLGHPDVVDGVAHELRSMSNSDEIRIFGACSTVDQVLGRLGINIAGQGVVVCTGPSVVRGEVELDTSKTTLIMQASQSATALQSLAYLPKRPALTPLQDRLIDAYGPDHSSTLISLETEFQTFFTREIRLIDLANSFASFNPWVSLLIKPGRIRPVDTSCLARQLDLKVLGSWFDSPLDVALRKGEG